MVNLCNYLNFIYMSLQYGIPKGYSTDVKQWYPSPSANLTGTITSRGRTFDGTGTKFLSELALGDWVLDPATDETVLVERIESDTMFWSSDRFTVDVSGIDFQRIKSAKYKQLIVIFEGINGGHIKGIDQPAPGGHFPAGIQIPFYANGQNSPILITPGTSAIASVAVVE